MATVSAWAWWPGPETNVLRLFSDPMPEDVVSDPWVDDDDVTLYTKLGERDGARGQIVGIEIIDFLDFDRWDDLPKLDARWQLPDWEPLPLDELLKRVQRELRQRQLVAAQREASAPEG